jgi:O-antigen/teichoic acid export membrane protein
MAIRRTYARTAALSTILTNLGFIINLIYGRILADTIHPANMGTIAAIATLASLIEGIAVFGITYTITQKTSSTLGKGDVDKAKGILAKGLLVFYAVSIPLSIVLCLSTLLILYLFFFYNLFFWGGLLLLYIILLIVMRSESESMSSMAETDNTVVFTNLRRYLSWFLSLFLLFALLSFIGVIYGWILSLVIFVIIGSVVVARYVRGAKIRIGLPVATYLTFGIPIFLASVIRLFGRYIDQLYVLALMAPEELAQYFFVVRITGALTDFSLSLVAGVFALLALLVGISMERMQQAHGAVLRFVLVISTPLFIAVAAFGEPIALLFLGVNYPGSGILLSILAIAAFFDLILSLLMIGRRAAGNIKIIPITWGGLLAIKLILVLLLASLGLVGITIAVFLSELITATILYLYLMKEIHVGKFWIKLFIPMIIVIVIGLGSTLLGLDVILALILCIFSVVISVFVGLRFRVLSSGDIGIIRSVVSPKLKWVIDLIIRIGGYPAEDFNNTKEAP